MGDFILDLEIETELAGIRGKKEKESAVQLKQNHEKPIISERGEVHSKPSSGESTKASNDTVVADEPVTVFTNQAQTEVSDSNQEGLSDEPLEHSMSVDWKQFKTMHGVFEHVGGERPIRLNPNIKRSQISGIPEPMLRVVQRRLQENHEGAVVTFPWGEYEITEKNRVFTTKASLMRYLLFDSFRDASGMHVQYAKQWMVLQFPVFDKGFNPDVHLGSHNDELDIYALLFVAHTSEDHPESLSTLRKMEPDHQTAERLGMLNMSVGRLLDRLNEHEEIMNERIERLHMTQTVMLLDRMGLLKGGLPKNVDEFVRVLEQNRETLSATDTVIDRHTESEKDRRKTLARQERMKEMRARS